MALVMKTPEALQAWRQQIAPDLKVGFVPTMGALHAGHETLLKQAAAENDIVVLSIFVNPTQFNDPKDFEKYPATWDQDVKMAEKNGVHIIFAPQFDSMYPDNYKYKVVENDFSLKLCGADRPGHFDGVLSVVMKLFLLVRPFKAYFGEKDFQQLSLIQGMVKAFFLPLEIVPVPTVREADGLAMSSRNVRLTPEQRALAPKIYQTLKSSSSALEAQKTFESWGWKVDYVTDLNQRRFAAVRMGEVRLIDNVSI